MLDIIKCRSRCEITSTTIHEKQINTRKTPLDVIIIINGYKKINMLGLPKSRLPWQQAIDSQSVYPL